MLEKLLMKDKDALDFKTALGRKFDDFYGKFEEDLIEPIQKYQQLIKMLYNKKENTILYCERELSKEQISAEKRCIDEIKKFQKFRKRAQTELDARGDDRGDEEEYGNMLKDELKNLETQLMDIEMSLKAVLLLSTNAFKEKVGIIIAEIKGKTDDFIELAKDNS